MPGNHLSLRAVEESGERILKDFPGVDEMSLETWEDLYSGEALREGHFMQENNFEAEFHQVSLFNNI